MKRIIQDMPNIYQRKETGIYYFKKQINGILHRISLKTKDYFTAHQLVKQWNEEFLHNKIRGQEIPLLQIKNEQVTTKEISDNRPTLIQAYNNFLRTCKNNHNSDDRLKGKARFKNVLIMNNWVWSDLTHEKVLDLQDRVQKDYKPHTAYKMMSFLCCKFL